MWTYVCQANSTQMREVFFVHKVLTSTHQVLQPFHRSNGLLIGRSCNQFAFPFQIPAEGGIIPCDTIHGDGKNVWIEWVKSWCHNIIFLYRFSSKIFKMVIVIHIGIVCWPITPWWVLVKRSWIGGHSVESEQNSCEKQRSTAPTFWTM